MAVPHRVRQDIAQRVRDELVQRHRLLRQRQVEQPPAQGVRERLPDLPRGQHAQIVGDAVHERVCRVAELPQLVFARRARLRVAHAPSIALPHWPHDLAQPDERPLKRGTFLPDKLHMRGRIALVTALTTMLVGGAAALPAAANYPTVTEFTTGLTSNSGPWGIVDGPSDRLWFTENKLDALGSLSADANVFTSSTGLGTVGNGRGIANGPDGNLWVAQAGGGGRIARISPSGTVDGVLGARKSAAVDVPGGHHRGPRRQPLVRQPEPRVRRSHHDDRRRHHLQRRHHAEQRPELDHGRT